MDLGSKSCAVPLSIDVGEPDNVVSISRDTEELQKCAATGERNEVIRLLNSKQTQINSPNSEGKTPLHVASLQGHKDVVEVLMSKIPSSGEALAVNVPDRDGNLPLHLAVMENHLDVVKMLVDYGNAAVNARNGLGETPLLLASRAGHTEIVAFLLLQRIGADVNVACHDNWTAVHAAACYGHEEVVTLLTRQRNLVVNTMDGQKMSTPLISAVELCARIPEPILGGGEPLISPTAGGKSPDPPGMSEHELMVRRVKTIVTSLLVKGADVRAVDANGQTALHRGARHGCKEVVELLLNPKYSVEKTGTGRHSHAAKGMVVTTEHPLAHIHDSEGRTALHMAAAHGCAEVVGMLSRKKPAVDNNGDTALHVACRLGHQTVVEELAGNSLANSKGETALVAAVEANHVAIVEFLLTSPRTKDAVVAPPVYGPDGERTGVARHPLQAAVEAGHEEMLRLLLREKLDVFAVDLHLRTALHNAAYLGRRVMAAMLIESGCPVNQCDAKEQAPIHTAARAGHEAVIELLLVRGAEIDERDAKGRTPLFLAAKAGHARAVKFLLLKQARFDIANARDVSPYLVAYEMKSQNGGEHEARYLEVLMLLAKEGAADERKLLPQYRSLKLDNDLNKLMAVGSVVLSYVDVITDVTSLMIYYQSGNVAYFALGVSFVLIPSSMIISLQHTVTDRVLALLQLLLLKEFIVSFFYKREETPVLSTLKIIESVAEACPSSLLQVYILLDFILRPGAPTALTGLGLANSIILFSLCMSMVSTSVTLSNAIVLPEESEPTFNGYRVRCLCMGACSDAASSPYMSFKGSSSGSSRLRAAEKESKRGINLLGAALFRAYGMALHFFELVFRVLAMSSIFLAYGRYALPMLVMDYLLRFAITRYLAEVETTKSWSEFVKFACKVLLSLATDCIWIDNRLATLCLFALTIVEGSLCAVMVLYVSSYAKENYAPARIVSLIFAGIFALFMKTVLLGSRYLSVHFTKARAARIAPEPSSPGVLGSPGRNKRRSSVLIPGVNREVDTTDCCMCCV